MIDPLTNKDMLRVNCDEPGAPYNAYSLARVMVDGLEEWQAKCLLADLLGTIMHGYSDTGPMPEQVWYLLTAFAGAPRNDGSSREDGGY